MVRVSERKDFQLVNKDLAHTNQQIEHDKEEAPGHYGQGLLLWLESGDFVPNLYLGGVRGSQTHLPRS